MSDGRYQLSQELPPLCILTLQAAASSRMVSGGWKMSDGRCRASQELPPPCIQSGRIIANYSQLYPSCTSLHPFRQMSGGIRQVVSVIEQFRNSRPSASIQVVGGISRMVSGGISYRGGRCRMVSGIKVSGGWQVVSGRWQVSGTPTSLHPDPASCCIQSGRIIANYSQLQPSCTSLHPFRWQVVGGISRMVSGGISY